MVTFQNHGTADVLPLMLGGNTFGWTTSESQSHRLLDSFVDHGGSLVDTADIYSAWVPGNSGGESEKIIGSWLHSSQRRESLILGTKVGQHPEFSGLRASNIESAVNASLNRLQTDYIDVYYAHIDDSAVPLEEVVDSFSRLVTSGKVLQIGLSNFSGTRLRAWLDAARAMGLTLPSVLQPSYNLLDRSGYEAQLQAIAVSECLAVMPYFGLASGLLSGKYRSTADINGTDRAAITRGFESQRAWDVIAIVREIAADHSVAPAAVALGWLLTRPGVYAPIASARNEQQLAELMLLTSFTLGAEDLRRLEAVSTETNPSDGSG